MRPGEWGILAILITAVLIVAACQLAQQAPGTAAPLAPAQKPIVEQTKPAIQRAKPAAEKPTAQAGAKELRIATCEPDRANGLSTAWAYREFAERVQKRSNS